MSSSESKQATHAKFRDIRCWVGGAIFATILCVISVAYLGRLSAADPEAGEMYQMLSVLLVATIVFATVFSISFTSPPTTTAMRVLFVTAYIFSLTSIFFPLAMMMWVGTEKVQKRMVYSPVGIVQACALDISGGGKSIPEEIRCPERLSEIGGAGNQWILHLGGRVQPMSNRQVQLPADIVLRSDAQGLWLSGDYFIAKTRQLCTKRDASSGELTQCYGYDPSVVSREESGEYLIASNHVFQDDQGEYWVRVTDLNFENQKFIVYGGIPVPLYVVLISLMGGIVGLMRRVPELQREYWVERQAKMQNGIEDIQQSFAVAYKIRDRIIFQVLQVVSAPLIALVAFHLFAPASTVSAVSLAFISGFASEAILIKIRELSDSFNKSDDGKDDQKNAAKVKVDKS
ncbi:hypothetical protein P886_0587 [Alteromonadaceae bacterium 2753L.S.0a.02]|nr:hypothetical protein P886_0587 [Alteromonadaceae bacterium 2753L.S.0a.02]